VCRPSTCYPAQEIIVHIDSLLSILLLPPLRILALGEVCRALHVDADLEVQVLAISCSRDFDAQAHRLQVPHIVVCSDDIRILCTAVSLLADPVLTAFLITLPIVQYRKVLQ